MTKYRLDWGDDRVYTSLVKARAKAYDLVGPRDRECDIYTVQGVHVGRVDYVGRGDRFTSTGRLIFGKGQYAWYEPLARFPRWLNRNGTLKQN